MNLSNSIDFLTLLVNQKRPLKDIEKIQFKRFKKLLRYAYDHVPFYQKLLQERNIHPYNIRNEHELEKLPLTSKNLLNSLSIDELISRKIELERCRSSATSGSTGIPLTIYFRKKDFTRMNLNWARAFLNGGMKLWHKSVSFKGQKTVREKAYWYERLGIWRGREVSTWRPPEEWLRAIMQWKPQVMLGYVMTLRILAETVEMQQVQAFPPRIIFHTSAILDETSRRYFESVFRAEVIDVYGSFESGCMAWECKPCKGYHICSDMVKVEILKEGQPVAPGERGEVVITNLHSYAMPFIRYRLGDMATLSSRTPECGCSFPLLERIDGRIDDFVVLPNGKRISPHPIYHCIDPVPGIKRWKVVQESSGCLAVEIEPKHSFDETSRMEVQRNLKTLLEGQVAVEIKVVDSIDVEPLQKFHAVTSKVSKDTV
jgi:phenylacetate-CoA ligase